MSATRYFMWAILQLSTFKNITSLLMRFLFLFLKLDCDLRGAVELPAAAAVSPESTQTCCPLTGRRGFTVAVWTAGAVGLLRTSGEAHVVRPRHSHAFSPFLAEVLRDGVSLGKAFLIPVPCPSSFMLWHFWCYFNVTFRSVRCLTSVVIQARYFSVTAVVLCARIVKPADGRVTGSGCDGGCVPSPAPGDMPWRVCWQCWVVEGVCTLGGARHPTCMRRWPLRSVKQGLGVRGDRGGAEEPCGGCVSTLHFPSVTPV